MLSGYPVVVLSPLVGLAANVAAHIVLSRIRKGSALMACLFGGTIVGFIFTAAINYFALLGGALAPSDAIYIIAMNAVTYMALSWCYFHFVNLNLASLRIRMLNEMVDASDGLTEGEIREIYDSEQIIDNRLQRLTDWGHLFEKDGRYFVGNPLFIIVFNLFEILKYLILGKGNKHLEGMAGNCSLMSSFRMLKESIRHLLHYDFFRFLVTGVVNTLFSYVLYAALILLGLDYRVTITVCTVITIIWNYFTTGRFVFDNRKSNLIFKFVAVYGLVYLINLTALMFLIKHGFSPLLSQAIVVPLIAVTSFSLNKIWVFRKQ